MKKTILSILLLALTFPCMADILRPRPSSEKEFKMREKFYKKKRAECPIAKPLFDGHNCRSCDEIDNIITNEHMKCEKICPNRIFKIEDKINYCVLKDYPKTNYAYFEHVGWREKCSSSYFQGSDGNCYTCSDIKNSGKGVPISESDCLSCKSTYHTERGCWLRCPANGQPLAMYTDHNQVHCFSCDTESEKVILGCENCPTRFLSNDGKCQFKCPKNAPLFGVKSGKCFSCDEQNLNETVLGCSRCPSKKWSELKKNGKCEKESSAYYKDNNLVVRDEKKRKNTAQEYSLPQNRKITEQDLINQIKYSRKKIKYR